MSIISQETWDNIPKEEKFRIVTRYNSLKRHKNSGGVFRDKLVELEDLFGEENLQPKPKIRIWSDVCSDDWIQVVNIDEFIQNNTDIEAKIANKLLATLKIAKLIELGYGGMLSEEEWKTIHGKGDTVPCIVWSTFYECLHIKKYEDVNKHFIAFHTLEQAEEFMSYPENVELLHQYFMT